MAEEKRKAAGFVRPTVDEVLERQSMLDMFAFSWYCFDCRSGTDHSKRQHDENVRAAYAAERRSPK